MEKEEEKKQPPRDTSIAVPNALTHTDDIEAKLEILREALRHEEQAWKTAKEHAKTIDQKLTVVDNKKRHAVQAQQEVKSQIIKMEENRNDRTRETQSMELHRRPLKAIEDQLRQFDYMFNNTTNTDEEAKTLLQKIRELETERANMLKYNVILSEMEQDRKNTIKLKAQEDILRTAVRKLTLEYNEVMAAAHSARTLRNGHKQSLTVMKQERINLKIAKRSGRTPQMLPVAPPAATVTAVCAVDSRQPVKASTVSSNSVGRGSAPVLSSSLANCPPFVETFSRNEDDDNPFLRFDQKSLETITTVDVQIEQEEVSEAQLLHLIAYFSTLNKSENSKSDDNVVVDTLSPVPVERLKLKQQERNKKPIVHNLQVMGQLQRLDISVPCCFGDVSFCIQALSNKLYELQCYRK